MVKKLFQQVRPHSRSFVARCSNGMLLIIEFAMTHMFSWKNRGMLAKLSKQFQIRLDCLLSTRIKVYSS